MPTSRLFLCHLLKFFENHFYFPHFWRDRHYIIIECAIPTPLLYCSSQDFGDGFIISSFDWVTDFSPLNTVPPKTTNFNNHNKRNTKKVIINRPAKCAIHHLLFLIIDSSVAPNQLTTRIHLRRVASVLKMTPVSMSYTHRLVLSCFWFTSPSERNRWQNGHVLMRRIRHQSLNWYARC